MQWEGENIEKQSMACNYYLFGYDMPLKMPLKDPGLID